MLYKKNHKDVIRRLEEFYSGKGQDKIYARMDVSDSAIEKYKHEYAKHTDDSLGRVKYPDIYERAEFWDRWMSTYTELEDDSLPSCYLSEFDEGLYGGIVGAEVRFLYDENTGWISSMAVPFITDLDEMRAFTIDEKGLWFERYKKQLDIFVDKSKGKFGISHFILITGLNFLFELRGATNAFWDVIENPEKVKTAIDFSLTLNMRIHDIFFEKVGLFHGGTCSNFAQWLPGKIVSESVDPYHMASVDTFEEWGRAGVEKIFGHFDGGVVHIHTNGHHLIENVSALKGLKAIYMVNDIDRPPVYLTIHDMMSRFNGIPIILAIPFNDFKKQLKEKSLDTNVLYNVSDVPDIDTANRVMEQVRNYRRS